MKLQALTALARRLDPVEVTGITADSRAVRPGYVFAALPGTVADGRAFIPNAIAAGAVAVLAVPGTKADVPVIESEEPRLTLAQIAMRFHSGQPDFVAGITGTNGKTSVARFVQQIWAACGKKAGTVGTLGAVAPGYEYALRHTTPDPVEIHQILSTMTSLGTTHLAMEISSHGLAQFRADGVQLSAAAFTNITRDHLDYHPDFQDYFDAKARLLTELLPAGKTAVINLDGPGAEDAVAATTRAGREVYTVGRAGRDIVLNAVEPTMEGLAIEVTVEGQSASMVLPLVGAFQADNALVAAGLAIVSGIPAARVLAALPHLTAAPGRMQKAGVREFAGGGSATAYVDFAHTPDAISTALSAIRPHTEGKLHIVFGAGGDRDKAKRPLMGSAALSGADRVIITDDNPRSETPSVIRAQVKDGRDQLLDIAERKEAIRIGVEGLAPGDVLLVAGKGHEQGQTIEGVTYPFDDVAVTQALMEEASS